MAAHDDGGSAVADSPNLGMDLNDSVGYSLVGGVRQLVAEYGIGDCEPGDEGLAGALQREVCKIQDLALVNTHFNVGPT